MPRGAFGESDSLRSTLGLTTAFAEARLECIAGLDYPLRLQHEQTRRSKVGRFALIEERECERRTTWGLGSSGRIASHESRADSEDS
jgi:hypothetical protein